MSDSDPLFSRSCHTNSIGKCTTRIDVPAPEDLADVIGALAALRGQSKSEYVRDLLARHAYGEFSHVQMMVHGKQGVNGKNTG